MTEPNNKKRRITSIDLTGDKPKVLKYTVRVIKKKEKTALQKYTEETGRRPSRLEWFLVLSADLPKDVKDMIVKFRPTHTQELVLDWMRKESEYQWVLRQRTAFLYDFRFELPTMTTLIDYLKSQIKLLGTRIMCQERFHGGGYDPETGEIHYHWKKGFSHSRNIFDPCNAPEGGWSYMIPWNKRWRLMLQILTTAAHRKRKHEPHWDGKGLGPSREEAMCWSWMEEYYD